MSTNVPQFALNTGASIPAVGFGTFQIPPEETQRAVEAALELGYRHIDTAAGYYNEAGVGAALRASGLKREEVFITTKLRNVDQGTDSARRALENSLKALGLDYVDLYLVHWPVPPRDLYVDSYRTVVEAHKEGLVKAPGVSNFLAEHLDRVIKEVGVVPAANQIEVHPTFSQAELRAYSRDKGIVVESYSPLGQGKDLTNPVVTDIATRIDATPAQVVLAWHLHHGNVIIPKSVTPERIAQNLASASLSLSNEDIAALDALTNADGRIGGDPAVFAHPQTLDGTWNS